MMSFANNKENEEEVCLPLDSPAEWNRFDLEGMCEQGSLTALLAFTTFLLAFGLSTWCYRRTLAVEPGKTSALEMAQFKEKKGPLVYFIKHHLINPWIPSSTEIFISVYFFLWFCLTITIGVTRFYAKKWTQEVFFQQGPFNYLAFAIFNCSTVDMTLVDYTDEIKDYHVKDPPKQSPEELDPYFMKHLAYGILWLSIGFYHILNAKEGWSKEPAVNKAIHRWFGRLVVMPSYLLHYYHAWKMVLRNPVAQRKIITFQYIGTLVDNVVLFYLGLKCIFLAKKEDDEKKKEELHQKHRNRMVFMYIESLFGAGTIRITAWILWIISKFCPYRIAMKLDRGVCQQSAVCRDQFLGSAESCWISTYVNLALGIYLNLLCEYLFANIDYNRFDADDKKTIERRVRSVSISLLVMIPFVIFEGDDEGTLGKFIYYGAFIVSIISRSLTLWNYISWKPEPAAVAANKWFSIAMAPQKVLRKLVGWDDV